MVVDRVVAVIRRHVLADDEASAWTALGRALAGRGAACGTGRALLAAVHAGHPRDGEGAAADGARRGPAARLPAPGAAAIAPPATKKAALIALYRAHPDYGNRAVASKVAAELAPAAGLQANTARSYLYAELEGRAS